MSYRRKYRMFQLRWLWANMKGSRRNYIIALFLSVACNALHIAAPYFQSRIIDTFVSNPNAAENLALHEDLLWKLLGGMIGFTLLRTVSQYS